MKILVTGGSGFIGTHLIRELIKNHSIASVEKKGKESRKDIETKFIDLSKLNPKQGLSKNFDIIIHLASYINLDLMMKEPRETITNNTSSTLNLLEDIRLNNPNCLFIFASSEKVYGSPSDKMIDENCKISPIDPYGLSKSVCETIIQNYHKNYNINYIIIRASNVFGYGQGPSLFIPSVLNKISEGENEIKVGSLKAHRNFVFIEDLIEFYLKCVSMNEAKNKIFNISSYSKNMEEVRDTIVKLTEKVKGKKINFITDPSKIRPSHIEPTFFEMNSDKANKILNWKPKKTFTEAMEITISKYLNKES